MWEACTAAGTDWWLCWWRCALLKAACVLTACLHAPRSSLDLNRAFISKWMTLNWSGKYTGCLLIIGRVYFFPSYCLYWHRRTNTESLYTARSSYWTGRHTLVQPMLTITVMSSEWQTIQSLAAPGSKAGPQLSTKDCDIEFWGILCPFFPHSSSSISLNLPPPIFHSFSIHSSSSPGIANTSAGGGGGSQTRVLVS